MFQALINKFSGKRKVRQVRQNYRPFLEKLDDRIVPGLLEWRGTVGDTLWNTAGNWRDLVTNQVSTRVPNQNDAAIFDANSNTTNCSLPIGAATGLCARLFSNSGFTSSLIVDTTLTIWGSNPCAGYPNSQWGGGFLTLDSYSATQVINEQGGTFNFIGGSIGPPTLLYTLGTWNVYSGASFNVNTAVVNPLFAESWKLGFDGGGNPNGTGAFNLQAAGGNLVGACDGEIGNGSILNIFAGAGGITPSWKPGSKIIIDSGGTLQKDGAMTTIDTQAYLNSGSTMTIKPTAGVEFTGDKSTSGTYGVKNEGGTIHLGNAATLQADNVYRQDAGEFIKDAPAGGSGNTSTLLTPEADFYGGELAMYQSSSTQFNIMLIQKADGTGANVNMTTNFTLYIQINGSSYGQCDKLNVPNGSVTLGGTLAANTENASPTTGWQYNIISIGGGSFWGAFAAFNFTGMDNSWALTTNNGLCTLTD